MARPSAPLTGKPSATFSLHDAGLACLSPGFQTHDPGRQEQLAKSVEVREQQRQMIEARLHKGAGKEVDLKSADPTGNNFFPKPSSRRKGPPPGLSIHAPDSRQFSGEPRVVHSAPLNQSFTGLNRAPAHNHPLSRQVLEHSHHHQQYRAPAAGEQASSTPQFGPITNNGPATANRLPPIQDVFNGAADNSSFRPREALSRENSTNGRTLFAPHANAGLAPGPSPQFPGPMHSPGLPPPSASLQPLPTGRQREFRSAEEAVQTLSGGREELMPKIVHYGAPHQAQPPTPPSPQPPNQAQGHNQGHHRNTSGNGPQPHSAQLQPQIQHTSLPTPQPSQGQNAQYGPLAVPSSSSASFPPGSRPDMGARRRTREEYERDYADTDRMEIDGERERERPRMRSGDWREEDAASAAMRGAVYHHDLRDRERDREREEQRKRRRQHEKREEFLHLCARAWDLLHEP